MKGYWIALYKKIGDMDNLKNYAAKVTPIIQNYGGKPFGRWIMPNTYDFILLMLIGLLGSIANLLLTQSYKLAEVTLTTPLKYLSLVFAIIIGFYFFNEIPTIYTLSGAALIVVSSAIIFFRESELKKPITLPRQQ